MTTNPKKNLFSKSPALLGLKLNDSDIETYHSEQDQWIRFTYSIFSHCVKSAHIRSFLWYIFCCIKNSIFGHFSHIVGYIYHLLILIRLSQIIILLTHKNRIKKYIFIHRHTKYMVYFLRFDIQIRRFKRFKRFKLYTSKQIYSNLKQRSE